MKLNHVLVIFKHRVSTEKALCGERNSKQILHAGAIAKVRACLKRRNIPAVFIDRNDLKGSVSADLIIAIGGDGTALAAAHLAGKIPLLCVNSLPGHSVGFFCAAIPATFAAAIDKIISGRLLPKELPLIEAKVNSKPLPTLALNEILFAGTTPAETASYIMKAGGRSEIQKSSGVWISAGPGSTAAIRSAGGRKIPVDSARLQFVVREPCQMSVKRAKLVRGILPEGAGVSITSLMTDAFAYTDGPRLSYPVPPGSKLTVRISKKTISIFI